jgi:enoyl-[acyl-carrier-protein] reductase (NADH)
VRAVLNVIDVGAEREIEPPFFSEHLMGISPEHFQALMERMSHTRRSTTELGNVAVFLASDLASGMTGTVANITGGKIVD